MVVKSIIPIAKENTSGTWNLWLNASLMAKSGILVVWSQTHLFWLKSSKSVISPTCLSLMVGRGAWDRYFQYALNLEFLGKGIGSYKCHFLSISLWYQAPFLRRTQDAQRSWTKVEPAAEGLVYNNNASSKERKGVTWFNAPCRNSALFVSLNEWETHSASLHPIARRAEDNNCRKLWANQLRLNLCPSMCFLWYSCKRWSLPSLASWSWWCD